MNFALNIRINERVMYANFGDPRLPDRNLRHKKEQERMAILGRKFINLLITQKPLGVQN